MIIERIVTGELEENTYFIINSNKNTLVVDPGSEANKLIDFITSNKLNVVGVLITHNHFDHVGALEDIKNRYNPVVVSKNNKVNNILDFNFDIIDTPGHTSDSVSYYFKDENILFSGDFLFKDTVGSTRFPSGNNYDMINSIEKIKEFNKDMVIYPGHGDKTVLSYEIENNIFFINTSLLS